MMYPIFKRGLTGTTTTSDGRAGSPKAEEIVALGRGTLDDPARYVVPEDVAQAINVSLILGMPLLVTGEPGTGKTELGRVIAHELHTAEPFKFETKSTSQAKDLFYTFDVIGRFGAPNIEGASSDPRDYISYHALGRAILDAFSRDAVAHLLSAGAARDHKGPKRSVVIIDEIDKAPRDFPNDLLNEIDRMAFRVPELQNATSPGFDGGTGIPSNLRPIVVITSNSEKGLPDPFLRRCVYVDITFPTPDELLSIVAARIEGIEGACPLVDDALALFAELRKPVGRAALNKRPGTAELLNWLQFLRTTGFRPQDRLTTRDARQRLEVSLVALIKNREDRDTARRLLDGLRPASD
jgi:MoxR-like ATPase